MDGEQKQLLLQFARRSIESKFKGEDISFSDVKHIDYRYGCFVTIRSDGELLGSMGFPEGDQPLYEAVHHAAVQAAFDDPRFDGITQNQLQNLRIEVAVLEDLKQLKGDSIQVIAAQINPKKHAVLVKKGFYTGLRLGHPQCEENAEEFLLSALKRAGLAEDVLLDERCQIYVAVADVFSEQ